MSSPCCKSTVRALLLDLGSLALGYIDEFEEIDDHRSGKIVVQLNGRINKAGVVSPRFNVSLPAIESWVNQLLPARSFGLVILTTSAGIVDHHEARRKHVAGKVRRTSPGGSNACRCSRMCTEQPTARPQPRSTLYGLLALGNGSVALPAQFDSRLYALSSLNSWSRPRHSAPWVRELAERAELIALQPLRLDAPSLMSSAFNKVGAPRAIGYDPAAKLSFRACSFCRARKGQ